MESAAISMAMSIGAIPLLFCGTAAITIAGALAVTMEACMPGFVVKIFKYGKMAPKALQSTPLDVQVPKRLFAHFYVFATGYTAFVVYTVVMVYMMGVPVPGWYREALGLLLPKTAVTVPPAVILLASVLFLMQVSRRMYECYFVSIFSPATMSIFHYVIGFVHYFGAATSSLCNAPGFTRVRNISNDYTLNLSDIGLNAWVGTALFIWAFYQQFVANIGLANLRKKKDGSISHEHHVPHGGLFELVSCPHYLTEVIIYIAMYLVLGFGNWAWLTVLVWVISNQTSSAVMCHEWYLKKFKNYPRKRKAIYPFLL